MIWYFVIAVAVIAIMFACYKLFGIDKIKSWLVWAVTEAEAQFGSGTGKLKLAFVYDLFITRFPKLQAIVPYALFASLVDAALEKMREMLKNEKIENLVIKKETK